MDILEIEIVADNLLSSKRSLADDMLKPNVEITQDLISSIY